MRWARVQNWKRGVLESGTASLYGFLNRSGIMKKRYNISIDPCGRTKGFYYYIVADELINPGVRYSWNLIASNSNRTTRDLSKYAGKIWNNKICNETLLEILYILKFFIEMLLEFRRNNCKLAKKPSISLILKRDLYIFPICIYFIAFMFRYINLYIFISIKFNLKFLYLLYIITFTS